jgi:hypothetical protein
LLELSSLISRARVAKEKELPSLELPTGIQLWGGPAANADVTSTVHRWCSVPCTIWMVVTMEAQAASRAGAAVETRPTAVR